MTRTVAVVIAGWAACIVIGMGAAPAQDWPTRPVTLVVPFAAGGPVDTAARIMATRLTDQLGQPVTVENIGGAGSMLGASRVAKAPPDGYTVLHGNRSTHIYSQILSKKPLYDAVADFAPVAAFVENSAVLIARKDFPADGLAAFGVWLRANPGRLQFASAGAGSASHVICVLLNGAIGVDIAHIPYRGTAPALQDLIAGRVDYLCDIISTAIPPIQAGLVKPLALLSSRRSPALPGLATADEQGLKGFDVDAWNAFFLPKGTPDPIVRRLARATSAVVEIPAVAKRLQEIGLQVAAAERRTPEYVARLVKTELETWRPPLLASGATMQ
ncbi:MAG: tripartite tricarboxylate transporter substrate binding protein BugD [Hyphomicrobiales bacterium]|nr:tripartite tricarboxylate transporter substrate binding protein BugD [Hyphomicrobiales bacterium]